MTVGGDRRRVDASRPTPSSSTSAWRRATSWRGWRPTCRSSVVGDAADSTRCRPPPTGGVVCRCMRDDGRRPRRGVGRGASPSWSWSSARRSPAPAPARAASACRTCAPGSPPGPAGRRPVHGPAGARQITLAEAAADVSVDAFRRTASTTSTSRSARAWTASAAGGGRGTTATPSRSTGRSARRVSVGDVSTLGKLVVSGPDVVEVLERHLPVPRRGHQARPVALRAAAQRARPRHGRRHDPARVGDAGSTLTFTTGGAANAEMWLRDWVDTWGLRVHVLDRTMSLAAINVTGPRAGELLRRARPGGPAALPGARPCRGRRRAVPRRCASSFTGEAAWELHHPIDRSVELWRALMAAGRRPRHPAARAPGALRAPAREGPRHRRHGHRAATPRRAGSGWTGRFGWTSREFIGRTALERTAAHPRRPPLGRVRDGRTGAGRGRRRSSIRRRRSSATSPAAGPRRCSARPCCSAGSGGRRTPTASRSTAATARRHADAVLRPGGRPCPRLSRSRRARRGRRRRRSTRCALRSPAQRRHLRLAPDDVLVHRHGRGRRRRPGRHRRARGRVRRGAWLDLAVVRAAHRMAAARRAAGLAQGAIAGVPAKVSLVRDDGTCTLITAAAYADELAERLGCA